MKELLKNYRTTLIGLFLIGISLGMLAFDKISVEVAMALIATGSGLLLARDAHTHSNPNNVQ